MEIKVGDYVRFKDGDIGKISQYEYNEAVVNGHYIWLEGEDCGLCCEPDTFKSSPNIIDLIEVGDFVNKNFVYKEATELVIGSQVVKVILIDDGEYLTSSQIHGIVTKEQFKQMEYRIEG